MHKLQTIILAFLINITLGFSQTLTDIDGNIYETVQIGTQIWLKENLKVTHFRNGDPIPEVQDSLQWVAQTQAAWCNNENKPANGEVYGKLYNWYVINDPRQIAPEGWHVPSDTEWKMLEMYLGMSASVADKENYRGTKEANALKTADTIKHWTLDCCPAPGLSKNKGNNSSGFSALGAGYRLYYNAGGNYTSFQKPTGNAQFWTSTSQTNSTAWLRHLCVYHEDIYRAHWPKTNGSSIRLVKDVSASSQLVQATGSAFNIYPHPANGYVFIHSALKDMQNAEVCIRDIMGRELPVHIEIENNRIKLNTTQLENGIYMCILKAEGSIYNFKLQIAR